MIRPAWALVLVFSAAFGVADPVVSVAPDVESGIYEPGREVAWTVQVKNGAEPAAGKFSWIVRPGGAGEQAKGEADLVDGKAKVNATRATPNAFKFIEGNRAIVGEFNWVF